MGTNIHPTAIVDPKAELGENVEIGPYCVIYAGVQIGDGCWLQNHVTVDGFSEIGKDNRFYAFTSIGQRTQDLKYSAEPTYFKMGDNNTVREFSTFNRATSPGDATIIGSHGNFLTYSHVGHDSIVGDHVIFSNNGTLGGHCEVGDHVIISGLSGVHQFCRIGNHAFIGGCTKIVKDVPPFMIADGNPAKVRTFNREGLKRRGFTSDEIDSVKEAFKILYRQNLGNTNEAVPLIEKMSNANAYTKELAEFVKNASARGIH